MVTVQQEDGTTHVLHRPGRRSTGLVDQVGIRLPDGVRAAYDDLAELVGSNGSVLMRQVIEANVPAMRELARRLKLKPAERVSDRLRIQALLFDLVERQGERLVRDLALTPEEEREQQDRLQAEEEAFRSHVEAEEEREQQDRLQAEEEEREQQDRLQAEEKAFRLHVEAEEEEREQQDHVEAAEEAFIRADAEQNLLINGERDEVDHEAVL